MYHEGIEIVDVDFGIPGANAFNCTMKELKLSFVLPLIRGSNSFNCTMKELKSGDAQKVGPYTELLIVP